MRFERKVVIVTGAGTGIGEATAMMFAREGARVVVADSDAGNGAQAAERIGGTGAECHFIQVDVSRADQVKALIEDTVSRFGAIDILVNNAGVYTKGDAVTTPEEEWDRILGVNAKGAFLCSKYAIPFMIETGKGTIVNIASEAGIVGLPNQVAYNVSKAAVIMLTKSMAVDFASRGIRVNAVCPGTTETPLVKKALEKEKDPRSARKALEQCRPANRLGRPEEIAAAVLAMASDELGYATGSALVIDGGYTAQ